MKKKFIRIFITVLMTIFALIFGRGIYFYEKYAVPNEKYFGEHYKEVLHIMSVQDVKQAKEVMKTIDEAFSFVGSKEDAEQSYGKLRRFCVTEKKQLQRYINWN